MDPERYDRVRPAYPQAVIDRVMAASPGLSLLDVGCGTGTEARQFQAAGCSVLGVDPDERMATVARAAGTTVEVSVFETWEPAGRCFDAVVSGTAWHWIDPIVGATKAAQALRPDGVLAPFGSVHQLPAEVARSLASAYREVAPDSPLTVDNRSERSLLDAYAGLYRRAADGIRHAGGFAEPVLWRYDWQRVCTVAQMLDIIRTSGNLTSLPQDQAIHVLAAVAAAASDLGETITLPYATWGLTAVRTNEQLHQAG